MSEFRSQLILVILDKGLLAFVLGALGFLAKRYLDSLSAQRAYAQRLAEEQIRAYKQVTFIVSVQFILLAQITRVLERKLTTEAEKQRAAEDYLALHTKLLENYCNEMPKLQSDLIFTSERVLTLLETYLRDFGKVVRMLEGKDQGLPAVAPAKLDLTLTSSQLFSTISEEISNFRAVGKHRKRVTQANVH